MSKTLLIELGCEELPARQIQDQAERLLDGLLKRLIDGGLFDADSPHRWLATPRRLAVLIENVRDRQPDRVLERKGPAEQAAFDDQGQPTRAAVGFARSVGLEVDQLQRLENEQGKWLYAEVKQAGQSLAECLPEWLAQTVADMAGARSMRWSDRSDKFLRPVRWIVALHGNDIVPLELFGLNAGRETQGHRVHAAGSHSIQSAEDYETTLEQAYVLADFAQRKNRIHQQLSEIEVSEGLGVNSSLTEDDDSGPFRQKANNELLNEVCGLVEWPVATLGSFDPAFLEVPSEALVSAMREHQKCFALYDQKGALAPKFITIANLESTEPATMAHGYERVIRPRLADSQFFYQQDLKTPLEKHLHGLKSAVFHPKLGSLFDKTQRMVELSRALAKPLESDPDTCARAAGLAKCDLMTQMVGEFPDLQGTMGRYYALANGQTDAVAFAIESHYRPRFASDQLPADRAGMVVALADRLDTLVGIFAAGQKPKGSKDPFALRRAALAVVRILDVSETSLSVSDALQYSQASMNNQIAVDDSTLTDVHNFITERMNSWLSSEFGVETNTIRAVAAGSACSVHEFVLRCRQLQAFADGGPAVDSLAAANKRAANILIQSDRSTFGEVNRSLLKIDAESALFTELNRIAPVVDSAMAAGQFEHALELLAQTRPTLDAFFDQVMVMDEDPKIRANRLALLQQVRLLFLKVADIALLGKA